MKKVAFDTNMLLNIRRFKIDVFSEAKMMFGKEVEFIIPKQVMEELEKLSQKKGETAKEAELAKKLVEMRAIKIVEVDEKGADDALRKLSKEAIIATNDKELKDSVREMNGKTLYLRQKKFLELA